MPRVERTLGEREKQAARNRHEAHAHPIGETLWSHFLLVPALACDAQEGEERRAEELAVGEGKASRGRRRGWRITPLFRPRIDSIDPSVGRIVRNNETRYRRRTRVRACTRECAQRRPRCARERRVCHGSLTREASGVRQLRPGPSSPCPELSARLQSRLFLPPRPPSCFFPFVALARARAARSTLSASTGPVRRACGLPAARRNKPQCSGPGADKARTDRSAALTFF